MVVSFRLVQLLGSQPCYTQDIPLILVLGRQRKGDFFLGRGWGEIEASLVYTSNSRPGRPPEEEPVSKKEIGP